MINSEDMQQLSTMLTDAQNSAIQAQEKQKSEEKPKTTEQQQKKLSQRVEETLGMNFQTPKYDIIYKQVVEASEVYGGFQQMTPSTMDSQYLVIQIQLPNESVKNVEIEISQSTLTLFSKYHRLHLELPHDVNEKTAKAKWKNNGLEVTVRRKDVE